MNIDFFKEVSATELYITKNILTLIKSKKFVKELENNTIILGLNNKIGKNALIILLENKCYEHIKKIISLNSDVLNYKNSNERNLLQSMLYHDDMHDYIYNIITKTENISKIIENKDITDMAFIDNCIHIISNNDNVKHIIKILKCISYIFHKHYERCNIKGDIINKLCFNISNDKYLIDILEYINIENQEYVCNMNECITYLLDNKKISIVDYIFNKVIYIKFINNGVNSIFNLVSYMGVNRWSNEGGNEGNGVDTRGNEGAIMNILINTMTKSNIFKIRDIYNNNLLLLILEKHNIEPSILKNIINNYNFDIYDNNIYNKNIYLLIKEKYKDLPIKTTNQINKSVSLSSISLKNILKKTVVGIFNSNLLHNMIYTTIFVKKYKRLILPCIENNSKSIKINDINFIKCSNNNGSILNTLNWYKSNYYDFSNHVIVWNSEDNYIIDTELLPFIHNNIKKSGIIYVKISIILSKINIRHANLLIIDTDKKTVERFEPYGEIYYDSILQLDDVLKKEICDKLEGYKYIITQSYPGFQSKSDELNEMHVAYGDPEGYCLAWCYLYLELRLIYSDSTSNIDVIKVINDYICNNFEKDFKFNKNDNKYMIFIRYYSNRLDSLKNNLLKEYNIKYDDIYKDDIGNENTNIIITNTNKDMCKPYI
jgi:hypothetical protein